MINTLFPTDLPQLKWLKFKAEGYKTPAAGLIFRTQNPPCCGAPLGGLSTGCVDLDVRGVYGFSTLFNPGMIHPVHGEDRNWRMPRKYPKIQPVLGLAAGDKVWVLASQELLSGGEVDWCIDPQMLEIRGHQIKKMSVACPKLEGVETVKDIHYWGHYPIVDMEYETDAPVTVGLRAWSPFIPGELALSNTPAAVFEVHLRNKTEQAQKGKIVLNFPGPESDEARGTEFIRQTVNEDFNGILVSSSGDVSYFLGVTGDEAVKFGSGLGNHPAAWAKVVSDLPQPIFRQEEGVKLYQEAGCSAAVEFDIKAGTEKVVNFVLTWYAPIWEGGRNVKTSINHPHTWLSDKWIGDTNYYTHMYAARYSSAVDVARRIVTERQVLLSKILAWQAVIYNEGTIPTWLQDSLINSLALIPETTHWAQAKPPLGDWVYPLGVFGMNESPRGCPHMDCIPCDWYGNLPIVFFFPELARTTLRAFKTFQREDGEIPFAIGKIGDLPDMATPEYFWQVSLNGMCYIDLVDRVWQRTGDIGVLKEFYASVKKCNTFTMDLRKGPGGVISMPEIGGMEWFEFGEWAGMASHMGGLRLAELRMMIRMAEAMQDNEYVQVCNAWLADGLRAMEEDMWAGSYYLNFYEKETGKKSDDVMGYQLDGEWTSLYHGLPGVFNPERVKITLETIKRCNIALTPNVGAANFARPDGAPLPDTSKVAAYGLFAMFPPEVVLLGMTYMYAGSKEYGLDVIRKHWETLVINQRHAWDLPNIVRGDNGKRMFGTDYYQDMMLWAVPAAIAEEDLAASCKPNSLVDKIIAAGKVNG